MAHVEVSAGICGFKTDIVAVAHDMYAVRVEIISECGKVAKLAEVLADASQPLSALDELFRPMPDTAVYQAAGQAGLHVACPVPSGVLKAIEVAARMALPADVTMVIRR